MSVRQRGPTGTGLWMALGLLLSFRCSAATVKPDPFAGDPRGEKLVMVSAEGLPVSDLLALVGQKTGVSLTADRGVADDKVMVFGPARPLRELLADLAALFNDRWERHKSPEGTVRYVLTRELPARRYEAQLARAVTDRVMARLAEQVRALDETPEQLSQRPEKDPIRVFLSEGELGRLGTLFYAALSPAQREALLALRRLSIPFAALAPEHQAPLRKAWAERIAAEQELARQFQAEQPGRRFIIHQPEDLENGTLRFRVQHTGGFLSVGLGLGAGPVRVDAAVDDSGKTTYTTNGWPIALIDSRTGWLLPVRGNPYTGDKPPVDASVPEARVTQAAAQARSWPDRLRLLAEKSGLALIADFYRGKPLVRPPDQASAGTAETASTALDALCEPSGYLWWTRGNTLLLRKRDWFAQQSYEVPDHWLQAMAHRLEKGRGVPTVGDLLALRDLTETQIAGLNSLSRNGYTADDDELTGLGELLAIAAASGIDRSALLPAPGATGPAIPELRQATLTVGQQALVSAFADAVGRLIPPTKDPGFQARFFRAEEKIQTGDRGCRYVPIRIEWSLGQNAAPSSYAISLPASLPADRRNHTRVELAS